MMKEISLRNAEMGNVGTRLIAKIGPSLIAISFQQGDRLGIGIKVQREHPNVGLDKVMICQVAGELRLIEIFLAIALPRAQP